MKVIDEDEEIQPRARIYINKKDDNKFISHEYISWIMVGSHNYKVDNDMAEQEPIKDHDAFIEYLKSVSLDDDFK